MDETEIKRREIVMALIKVPYVEPPDETTIKKCRLCGKRRMRKFFYRAEEFPDERRPECVTCYDNNYRKTKTNRKHLEFRKKLRERNKNGRPSTDVHCDKEPKSE